tara:strand:+ start:1234 stop:1689 length:456 start_codon:yes stop_codon:yes gene_type:complete
MAVNRTKQEAARTGAAVSPTWGGPQKQRYYTPTGVEVLAIPSWREFVRKGPDGKILEQGTRDANLDKGWSFALPTELKVTCPGCSKWHDTEEEVDACVDKKAAAAAQWERKALEQQPQSQDAEMEERLGKLEEGLSDIKTLLQQALGAKNG